MSDAEKITPIRPDDIAGYVIRCHDGDAKAAVEALLGEIEHLQEQLSLAVAIMGKGYTRGWTPLDGIGR
ncbi:hypothetical protein [Agrobacterium sp. 22-226-1]